MIYFFLWNNAFSKETSTSSRTPKEHCTLDTENGNTEKNVAKMLNEEDTILFLQQLPSIEAHVDFKDVFLETETKEHKEIIWGSGWQDSFFLSDKRKEKGRAQSQIECQECYF